jgi:RNA polymerase sigma factor for flagellar operon FliA
MLDELRRYDWTPRSVHRKARAIAEAIQAIEMQTGRDARDSEVANQLGLALAEYYRVLQDIMGCRVLSIEELLEAGDTGFGQSSQTSLEPMEGLTRARFASSLADAIASLPERERLIISLYYNDERNLREIAQVLSISESRVCQIQGQALLRLRARLGEWLDEPSATASAGRSAGSRSTRRRKTPPSPDA